MCDAPDMINAIVILSANTPFAEIMAAFENMGFELMRLNETNGFLISGELSLFNSSFPVELLQNENGGAFHVDADGIEHIQLPYEQLGEDIRHYIDAIELQQPIEFGPLDY